MAYRIVPCRGSVRYGVTLTDVIVSIVLVLFLSGVAMPQLFGNRERANRIKCASNLKMIGQAMILYANENNGRFPRTYYDVKSDKLASYSKPDIAQPFANGDDGMTEGDVTAPLFLLVRTQDIDPAVFICPSSKAELLYPTLKDPKDRAAEVQKHSNFPSSKNLSYSMQVPYPSRKGLEDGFRWTDTLKADFATVADMNPGTEQLTQLTALSPEPDLQKGNSLNHQNSGQNVLYGDGHVDWAKSPFCGIEQDNIYTYGPSGKTAGGVGIVGRPIAANDSTLLPTANDEGKPADGAK